MPVRKPSLHQKLDKLNPLSQIYDLIQVLNPIISEYMIAGGFVRDWYQGTPFNDVDIYLFNTTLDRIEDKLRKTNRFEIIRSHPYFIEAVFHENFISGIDISSSKGPPKHTIQLISWHSSPDEAVASFDFEHCKFFVPIIQQPLHLYSPFRRLGEVESESAYAHIGATEALTSKILKLSKHSLIQLEALSDGSKSATDSTLALFEKYIKRTKKFKTRGFIVPSEVLSILCSTADKFLTGMSNSKYPSERKSALLENIDYEHPGDEGASQYSFNQIAVNLIRDLIMLHSEAERAIFLLSTSSLVRDVAKKIEEGQFEEFFEELAPVERPKKQNIFDEMEWF